MADSTNLSGVKTSEFGLTAASMLLGAVLEGVAVVMNQLQANGIDKPWMHAVMVVAGMLLQITSLYGYQRSRTSVKMGALAQGLPIESAAIPPSAKPTPPGMAPLPLP